MKITFTLFALFFTACAAFAQPNTYYYHAPDMPDENISGLFLESPLTLQYPEMVVAKGIKSVVAYKNLWDTLANSWGDTVMVFKQEITETTASIMASETRWRKNGAQLTPLQKIEIYNHPTWTWGSILSSDSVKTYYWDVATNVWELDKKITFKRYKWYVTERSVFNGNNLQPDNIWIYAFPGIGEITCHRKEKLSTGDYLVRDSLFYLCQFDTLCDYYYHSVWNESLGAFRIEEHFNLSHIQKIVGIARYVYVNGGGNPFFVSQIYKGKYEDTKVTLFAIDTFVLGAPDLLDLYTRLFEFGSDWRPKRKKEEFLYSLSGPQDSFVRHNYVLHDSLKLVISSTKEKRIYIFEPYLPQLRWLFSFAGEAVSSSQEPQPLKSKAQIQIYGTVSGEQMVQLVDWHNSNKEKKITVFGRDGTVCYQDIFLGETHRFNLEGFPPGAYIAQVSSSDGAVAKQFLYLR